MTAGMKMTNTGTGHQIDRMVVTMIDMVVTGVKRSMMIEIETEEGIEIEEGVESMVEEIGAEA